MPDTYMSYSQPSWNLSSSDVDLAVTITGGHMAPVRFFKHSKDPIEPYYINPWHSEGLVPEPEVLVPLRGDFFCLPFGADNAVGSEDHPIHGETATSDWTFLGKAVQDNVSRLSLLLETKCRPGKVYKSLSLVDGQNAVYTSDRIEGFKGKSTYGHHATLRAPETKGQLLISQSPILFGEVEPGPSIKNCNGEYYSLKQGARFSRLEEVPSLWNQPVVRDCSVFPDDEGFVDIISTFAMQDTTKPFWSCAVNASEGYLWYSLKDPSVLPATVFWRENYGRHQHPWLGRNCCIGIEEVCAYFTLGNKKSVEDNHLIRQGISTCHEFDNEPFSVNTIQGCIQIPRKFGRVVSAEFGEKSVTFIDGEGVEVSTEVFPDFVFSGGFL